MHNSEQTLQKFVDRAKRLYSLPAVAIKVLELTAQPQVDIRALKECIENDPAITTKVLRVVNSSLFGLSREVSDLNQALALLGIKPLKLLVLGFSLSDVVFTKFTGKIMLRFWRHTLTKAVAAREIAETICHIPGDEPFIAALLQDIGMLVLLQDLGEPYAKLLSRPFATQHDLADWEIESFGFDHTELTARLLANWGLPESLQTAVAVSTGAQPAANALSQILQLSHLLADLVIDARHDLLANLLDSSTADCRLTQADLSSLVSTLQDKVAQLADVFSLELPPGMDYRDVLVQAHARMSEVAAELTTELVKRNRPRGAAGSEATHMLDDVQALSSAVARFMGRSGAAAPNHGNTLAQQPTVAVAKKSRLDSAAADFSPKPAILTTGAADREGEVGLLNRLSAAIHICRQSRCALTLALVEIDHFPELVLEHGAPYSARLVEIVRDFCHKIDVKQVECIPLRPQCLALAMTDCDRQQAAKLLRQLVKDLRRVAPANGGGVTTALSVSVGISSVDLPTKNFSPKTLYDSAARCLSAAQLSGGNTLKSIVTY